MKACQLIGKKALRTKPADLQNGNKDYSYSAGYPVLIKSYNGFNIGIVSSLSTREHFLDGRWDDDNWIEIPPDASNPIDQCCKCCCPYGMAS